MARTLDSTCKMARRYGKDLEFKKDLKSKCKADVRPGQHGQNRKRETNYGTQLNEKQALKFKYCVLEKQFRRLYNIAENRKGPTGVNLLQLLESRLDNIVFRMGYAASRKEARQLVSHKSILVNGKVMNIPSFEVKVGDIVEVREKAKSQNRVVESLNYAEDTGWVEWLDVDPKKMTGTFKRVPDRDELPSDINELLVVELYSK